MKRHVKVWSPAVRLLHWTLVTSFCFAYYTRDSELNRDIHVDAGYVAGCVILIRLLVGIFARDHASFWSFPPKFRAALDYMRGIISGKAHRHIGHNPAGSLAVYALLGTMLATVVSGYLSFEQIGLPLAIGGDEGAQSLHALLSTTLLVLIGIHLTGVIVGSIFHRENLVRSMLTGMKPLHTESHSEWDFGEIFSELLMSTFFTLLRGMHRMIRLCGGKGILIEDRRRHWRPGMN